MKWLTRISWPELRSGVFLLRRLLTFMLLPLLPDRTIDPWNVLNPHAIVADDHSGSLRFSFGGLLRSLSSWGT